MLRTGEKEKFSKARLKEVKSIQFGLFSPGEIEEMAVCKITFNENVNSNLNDNRMGPIDYIIFNSIKCSTCNCDLYDCPEHFGYIHLEMSVFHIGYIKECANLLNFICKKCGEVLIDNYEQCEEINKIKEPKTRQSKIIKLCKNIFVCEKRSPKVKNLTYEEQVHSKFYKEGCKEKQFKNYQERFLKFVYK